MDEQRTLVAIGFERNRDQGIGGRGSVGICQDQGLPRRNPIEQCGRVGVGVDDFAARLALSTWYRDGPIMASANTMKPIPARTTKKRIAVLMTSSEPHGRRAAGLTLSGSRTSQW